MIAILLTFIIYACAFGVAWWIISILPVPPVVKTIGYALLGLCVLVVLFSLAQGNLPLVRVNAL